jgi:hypothetical protein
MSGSTDPLAGEARALYARDQTSQAFGIRLVDVALFRGRSHQLERK